MPLHASVLWVTPSEAGTPQRSFARVRELVASEAVLVLEHLEVWRLTPHDPYDLQAEVQAIAEFTRARGPAHVFGFSAGATVALAAAHTLGEPVVSVAVCEPATIGDDDWSPVEREWRAQMNRICALEPRSSRPQAFAAAMVADPRTISDARPAPPSWDQRRDRLEAALRRVGFASFDLQRLSQSCLILTGANSHERFQLVANRLVEVIPHARAISYPGTSHLAPPMRERPSDVAADLLSFWHDAEHARPLEHHT